MTTDSVAEVPVEVRERCDLENCGICNSSGRDYRGMRWTPAPVLTTCERSAQRRSLRWWFTDRRTLLEALAWAGP